MTFRLTLKMINLLLVSDDLVNSGTLKCRHKIIVFELDRDCGGEKVRMGMTMKGL